MGRKDEQDRSRVVGTGDGNVVVYGKDGSPTQIMIDGRVRRVGMSQADRDLFRKGR